MTYDLKTMTRKELERLKTNVEKGLTRLDAKDKKAALAAAQKAAAAHGFTLSDLTGEAAPTKPLKKKAGPKSVSAPKYKNPENPEKTWTGKGRQPDWFKAALAAGKTPEEMEI